MLKKLYQLEHKDQNNECLFICNDLAPITFLKEGLFQFQKYIGQIEDAALAQQKAEQEAKDEANKVNIAPDAIDPPAHRLDEEQPIPEGNQPE